MVNSRRKYPLPKLSHIRNKLREVATEDFRLFTRNLRDAFKYLATCRHRNLIVISGSDPVKLSGITSQVVLNYLSYRSKEFKGCKTSILYVYHDEFEDSRLCEGVLRKVIKRFGINYRYERLVYEVSEKVLGTTHQVLIMDLLHDLKPNDIGRLLGIVEGGGIIIFLVPPLNTWVNSKTLFKTSLTVPKYPEPRNIFIKWFIDKLLKYEGIHVFDSDVGKIVKSSLHRVACKSSSKEIMIPETTVFSRELYGLALTQDQVEVIRLIEENFIKSPGKGSRVTLVIVADRGRGKSCSVGIGIVGLIAELLKVKNRVRVGITAHDSLSIQSLMRLAIKSLDKLNLKYNVIKRGGNIIEIKGDRFSIEYWQPSSIVKLSLDVLVVDEAAGIPVPLLHKMWLSSRRTIFATTIHGYEGAGRGFSVRFLGRIREDKNTRLLVYEMSEPIRYSAEDPVERFQFDVLLLNAEPDQISDEDLKYLSEGRYHYLKLSSEELFNESNERLLRSLFGIYVLAHYRNEPDDLGMLADAPHHSVRAVVLETGKVVAAAQLAEEGDIPEEYIDDLMHGGKIPGNIIPDRLLKHLRRKEYGKGIGWRIVRIAVHPQLQGRGIGSFLIRKIIDEACERGYDWVGSGFGVNKELLNFWIKNGFKVLHISPDRNPVSGEYTVLVLYPLKEEWRRLVNDALGEFLVKITESLHDVYRDLEPEVAYQLILQASTDLSKSLIINLTQTQIERLKLYVLGIMTYETVCDAINLLVKKLIYSGLLRGLNEYEGVLLVSKVLQGHSWSSVAEILGIDKNKAINDVRNIIAGLMSIAMP